MAGRRCAEAGLDIVTGGYGGTMEAASQGASEVGGHVVGVTAPTLFSGRSGANAYVSHAIEADSLTARIGTLTDLAVAAIVLPGSVGTAAELVVAWNLNHLARNQGTRRLPTVAVGDTWVDLWRLLASTAGASGDDLHTVDDAETAVSWTLKQPEVVEILDGGSSLNPA